MIEKDIYNLLLRNAEDKKSAMTKVMEYIKEHFGSIEDAFNQIEEFKKSNNKNNMKTEAGFFDKAKVWTLIGLMGLAFGMNAQEIMAGDLKQMETKLEQSIDNDTAKSNITEKDTVKEEKKEIVGIKLDASYEQVEDGDKKAINDILKNIKKERFGSATFTTSDNVVLYVAYINNVRNFEMAREMAKSRATQQKAQHLGKTEETDSGRSVSYTGPGVLTVSFFNFKKGMLFIGR